MYSIIKVHLSIFNMDCNLYNRLYLYLTLYAKEIRQQTEGKVKNDTR